jgi:hypothetical protein
MASTVTDLPAALSEALGYMQRSIACPEDVKARIAALRVPLEDVPGTRMTTSWRSSGPPPSHDAGGGGGWRQQHSGGGSNGGRWNGGGGGGGPRHHSGGGSGGGHPARWQHNGGGGAPTVFRPRRPIQDAPRFGNRGRKDATTEERMMDRIRDKMNKFSDLTYDATKAWLSELLDSGETDFLTGFVTLVFEKAAAEPAFCATYARLINELRVAFPHLYTEVLRIFGEFIAVFEDAATEPDAGTAEYNAFVALRERRKFRCGYASFIGEVANLGILTIDDVVRTCGVVLDGLMSAKTMSDKGQLCEEYADCLKTMMLACETNIRPVVDPLVARVKVAMDRTGSPSLTNKARFGLMDVTDTF